MYLLINNDSSINYAGEHPVDEKLCFEGVALLEFPCQSVTEVMAEIPIKWACWHEEQQCIARFDFTSLLPDSLDTTDTETSEDTLDEEATT